MENRIQSLEEKEVNIQSSLASSVCRLNNDESQIKLCENKQMVQQVFYLFSKILLYSFGHLDCSTR